MLDEIRNNRPDKHAFAAHAPEEVKEYARAQLALVSDTQRIVANRTAAMANWLVASLLLLNGGAALASHSAAVHGHHGARWAGLFLSGIIVSLLNRWLISVMVAQPAQFIVRARIYWDLVASDGLRMPGEEEALERLRRNALRAAISLPIPAVLSAAAWAWGYCSLMPPGFPLN